ncbi:MAG: hypothetical protein KGZ37_04965 [Nitrosarchaeum sp.]|nr:hypothetical protein [Nitrosarchaeum sp.]
MIGIRDFATKSSINPIAKCYCSVSSLVPMTWPKVLDKFPENKEVLKKLPFLEGEEAGDWTLL